MSVTDRPSGRHTELDAARRERQLAAAKIARSVGASMLLAAHPATVAWLTGYAAELQFPLMPFSVMPLVVVDADGVTTLIVNRHDEESARITGAQVDTYATSTLELHWTPAAAHECLVRLVGSARVALESVVVPAYLAETLDWIGVDALLTGARMIKSADEIAMIRAAVAICDAAQAEIRRVARPGVREADLLGAAQVTVAQHADGRAPLISDILSGPRSAMIRGGPAPRVIGDDDLLLVDIAVRADAYWGDSAATVCVGEPTTAQRRDHRRATEALDRAVDMLRPGAQLADVDRAVRTDLGYPHHTGHGIGTWFHEPPRIAPDAPGIVRAGMVLAIEPAVYGERYGLRVERVIHVTDDGCEILSGHSIEL